MQDVIVIYVISHKKHQYIIISYVLLKNN